MLSDDAVRYMCMTATIVGVAFIVMLIIYICANQEIKKNENTCDWKNIVNQRDITISRQEYKIMELKEKLKEKE